MNSILFKNKLILAGLWGFVTLMIGLAVFGAYQSYSPVPYWDMWDGYIDFFENAITGDLSVWWAQHNEHRIVLARALFWSDLKWFGGTGRFLIAMNFVLVAASAVIFWKMIQNINTEKKFSFANQIFGLFIVAWLFLWVQQENLTWGFQSQFFMAQLLPLCALYWLQKSAIANNGLNGSFFVACSFGLASIGTMANGVIALPLMVLFAIFTRQGGLRVVVLIVLSTLALFFYFNGYHSLSYHGSLSQALKQNPFGVIQYVLIYLGSPFYYLLDFPGSPFYLLLRSLGNPFHCVLGQGGCDQLSALIPGMVLVLGSAWFAFRSVRQPRKNSLQLALLFFIVYIGGTALGTAGGRLIFGLDQAHSGRYTTPAIMAWAALFVLCVPSLLAMNRFKKALLCVPFGALALLMVLFQFVALDSKDTELFDRKVSALAVGLHIKDQGQIARIYPIADRALSLAEKPVAQNLSVFGTSQFRNIGKQIGTFTKQYDLPVCEGSLDGVGATDGDAGFVRVTGWVFDRGSKPHIQIVRFLNNQNKIVGYAITGLPRPDVVKAIDQAPLQSGFKGYLMSDQMGETITMHGEIETGPLCQLQVKIPVIPFSVVTEKPVATSVTVETNNVLAGNQWLGSDSYRSTIEGMHIYGSYINADSDVGSLSLRIKRGDRVFYRSGPTGGNQFIEIPGSSYPPVELPASTEWILLDFSSKFLPNEDFDVKFSDKGSGWGEWSAIAVKQSR